MAFFAGAVNLLSPGPIGSTTPNTGAFTTLDASNGTLTSSTPAFTLSQTWNSAGVTFTALRANVTATASSTSSLLADFQISGTSQFSVGYNGTNPVINLKSTTATVYNIAGSGASLLFYYNSTKANSICFTFGVPGIVMPSNGSYGFGSSTDVSSGTGDIYWTRDAAGVLAQRNSTNAQTFRLYNTYTDASNYERGFMRWATNVLEIGAEAAGTGTQRQLRFLLGTATASTPLSITQTWNGAGVTFTGIQANITDTASASGSLLMDLQIGGVSKFQVRKDGRVTITEGFYCSANSTLDGIITRQAAIYGGSDANGTLIIQNSNFNNFNMLKIGGTSSSFPALKRSSAVLQARLADDSGFAQVQGKLTTDTNYTVTAPSATGYLTIYDASGTAYKVLCST